MPTPVAIVGAGNAATALALLFARRRPVRLYAIEADVERDINTRHRNAKYLPGVKLPKHVRAFGNAAEAVHGANLVILAVPSHALPEALGLCAPFIHPDAIVGSITKGLDPDTLRPLSICAASILTKRQQRRLCLIGGPAVATELATGTPTALIIAGRDRNAALALARALHTDAVKVMTSDDLAGVGYAMALKNVYAIALGFCDGLRYPMNTKALVATLALEEMARILEAAGAKPETATSLAGLGDLIVTGFSPHGRNRTYGERLVGARSKRPTDLGLLTVEGITATASGKRLADRLRVAAPLLHAVAKCLSAPHHFERPFIAYIKRIGLIRV